MTKTSRAGASTIGLALAGAGLALAWCRFVSDEYILPEVVILAAGLLLASASVFFRREPLPPLSTPLDRPLCAVLLAWTLAAAFSLDPRYSAFGTYGSYTYGVWQAASCAALFQLTACLANDAERGMLLRCAVGAAAIAGGYAALQAAGLDPLVAYAELPNGRAFSTLGSPVFLGVYLAAWLPAALHLALSEHKRFGGAALALIAAGLLASVSRGAWLSSALGAALYLKLTGRLRVPRRPAVWAGAALACALAAAWGSHALSRRGALTLGRENERVAIWSVAGGLVAAHPWLGIGPDTFEQGLRAARTESFARLLTRGARLGHAHNDLLQVLATTGLAGFAAYLWLLGALAAAARRALAEEKDRARAAALVAGLAALCVNLQLNIASLPAYASAALAAGLLLRPRADRAASRRLKLGAALLFAAGSCAYAARLVAADRALKLASAASGAEAARLYERALALNPCELTYSLAYVNFLSSRAGKTAGAERQEAIDRLAALGPRATACHPNDSIAHYISGSGALMQALLGRRERLDDAERELDAALRLDPMRLDLLDWRRQAASLRGDKALEAVLLERGARLTR